jgi:hypothetical protein
MRYTILLVVVGAVHLPTTGSAADSPILKFYTSKPRAPKEGRVNEPYCGVVTEVTKDSITVHWPGEKKPMKFAVSETLAAGKVPKEPRAVPGINHKYLVPAPSMYRLKDVKVGDWVTIDYAHIGGVSICDHICIDKRPGGRMPALPEEAEGELRKDPDYIPYHEYWNAHWDLEDKGIPFPEKFGKDRQFPVAPPPREVKRGPAIAP